ncbi:MAG: hypothetical protein R3338_15730, partial [Thermoanaerobaculia bacterium]|nr:hypothetical protein [Thermoanaerobaculia bacterium]
MPRTVAMFVLLFLAGSIVWWQANWIRMRLSEDEYAGERGVLIVLGGFITIILGLNVMNFVDDIYIGWMEGSSSHDPPTRLDLLLHQIGLLGGFYTFAMVFWHVIRRRALDLEREIWEPRVEYGLTERQRLVAGAVLAVVSLPAVVRYGINPYGGIGMREGIFLLVLV